MPHEGKFLPEVCTVKFTDGTERYFNPNDQVEIGPASPRKEPCWRKFS